MLKKLENWLDKLNMDNSKNTANLLPIHEKNDFRGRFLDVVRLDKNKSVIEYLFDCLNDVNIAKSDLIKNHIKGEIIKSVVRDYIECENIAYLLNEKLYDLGKLDIEKCCKELDVKLFIRLSAILDISKDFVK